MKTSLPRTVALVTAVLGFLAASLNAQAPVVTPPKLDEALSMKGGKILVLQPVQMKQGQTLVVTHTGFSAPKPRGGNTQFGALLVVYSTDDATYGNVLYQDIFIPAAANISTPHVKVFNGYTAAAARQGIIAILIGLEDPPYPWAPSARWTRCFPVRSKTAPRSTEKSSSA